MASIRPQVLIFDDDKEWAEQIALLIRDKCDASTECAINRWRHEVTGSHWDAMVMDVQISGSPETGTDHAERAILEYGITSPVIVISGAWRLEDVKKRHPDIFFDYISKDDLSDRLPESIDRACSIDPRTAHVKRMLTSFAKKLGILKKEFPLELLDAMSKPLFESSNGKTVEDLINMIWGGTRYYLNNMGKTVFIVMRGITGKPT